MITFLKAHKRVITFSLVAVCALWLVRGIVNRSYFLPYFIVFVTLIFSQLFWIGRVLDIGERFIPGKPRRTWLAVIAAVVWVFFFLAYGRDIPYAAYPRLRRILIDEVFSVWMVGSWLGFGLVMGFWLLDRGVHGATWVYRYIGGGGAAHARAPDPGCHCPALAPPQASCSADGDCGQRHAVPSHGLRASLRKARCGSHSPTYRFGTPAQGVRGFSHRPAFRHSY